MMRLNQETEREKEHQDLINKMDRMEEGSEERCRFTCSEHELRYIDFPPQIKESKQFIQLSMVDSFFFF